MYRNFKEMPIWIKSIDAAEKIYKLTDNLPRKEDYGLTSQIRRSALSISANIAEAFGRHHKYEKINFYYVSRGSLTETRSHLEYGRRVGYFKDNPVKELDKNLEEIYNDINKIILKLRKSKK